MCWGRWAPPVEDGVGAALEQKHAAGSAYDHVQMAMTHVQHMCEIMSVIQNQIHAGPLLKRVGFLSRVGLQTVHYVERN